MEAVDYEQYIGKTCTKKSIMNNTNYKVNTIKSVINHPHLNIPAFIFNEDDSYVECRRVNILN
jgi:hypothetical protein